MECTINRVRDRYFDQAERSGHSARLDDLERFADLGIRAIRYPVLWERTAPAPGTADWTWADSRLRKLRELGVRPIVGLLHHGSGPRHTDLLDPRFPELFAEYARTVAERFPWVAEWTPINEPLTTARFSALYGHWYPHARDDRAFVRALVHQCRATILAMRAIRAVNPDAQLVTTEDLGRTYATPRLQSQAMFENDRRWASLDLLTGRIDRAAPFMAWARGLGLSDAELDWFEEHGVPPDVVGINHYPTSQRYLDERIGSYPAWSHGGNGQIAYADVEAVRARGAGIAPIRELLTEAWSRYARPVAVTECHIWSTREQQLRWLADTWSDASLLARTGVDVRAVTVWALLGTFDWDRLVTDAGLHYEPGAFDVSGGTPRETAIATATRSLATTGRVLHPAVEGPRWWRSPERIVIGSECQSWRDEQPSKARPILIVGSRGTLGQAFARLAAERGLAHVALGRPQIDIADPGSVDEVVAAVRPWAVVNAAGYVRVDDAETDPRCERDNALGARNLAHACRAKGIRLLTYSTDLVFDGRKRTPYVEADVVGPLSAYGRSKALAERYVLEEEADALVVRTSSFFGPWDRANFVTIAIESLERGLPVRAAEDVTVSPTYVPDLVHTSLDLLVDGASGLWHLAAPDALTWAELAARAAVACGLTADLVEHCLASGLGWIAPRPVFSALGSERGTSLAPLGDALERYAAARVVTEPAARAA